MPLVDNVTKWLNENGYPLEMEVARTLKTAGFGVVQSEYYEDPENQTHRETDIVAYEQHGEFDNRAIFALAIECKSGKSKPWVLFTETGDYPATLCVSRRASSASGRAVLNALSNSEDIQSLSLFSVPERTGYGLTVSLRNSNKDWAYDALMSVCKASIGLVNKLDNVNHASLVPYVWPIIVINAPLFESYINEKGEIVTSQIEKGLLIWRNPVINKHTLVQIYTKEQFDNEAETIREEANTFLQEAVTVKSRIG